MSLRKKVQFYSRDFTTDVTEQADAVYTGRKLRHLRAPWLLSVTRANAGATAPGTTSLVINMRVQHSDDGSTWSDVTGWTSILVNTVGAGDQELAHANQLKEWVRVVAGTATHSTWAAGIFSLCRTVMPTALCS